MIQYYQVINKMFQCFNSYGERGCVALPSSQPLKNTYTVITAYFTYILIINLLILGKWYVVLLSQFFFVLKQLLYFSQAFFKITFLDFIFKSRFRVLFTKLLLQFYFYFSQMKQRANYAKTRKKRIILTKCQAFLNNI